MWGYLYSHAENVHRNSRVNRTSHKVCLVTEHSGVNRTATWFNLSQNILEHIVQTHMVELITEHSTCRVNRTATLQKKFVRRGVVSWGNIPDLPPLYETLNRCWKINTILRKIRENRWVRTPGI